jgi:hypothetical protein
MSANEELIPEPPILREKLAQHVQDGRMLRALLKLSLRRAQEQQRRQSQDRQPHSADRREAVPT